MDFIFFYKGFDNFQGLVFLDIEAGDDVVEGAWPASKHVENGVGMSVELAFDFWSREIGDDFRPWSKEIGEFFQFPGRNALNETFCGRADGGIKLDFGKIHLSDQIGDFPDVIGRVVDALDQKDFQPDFFRAGPAETIEAREEFLESDLDHGAVDFHVYFLVSGVKGGNDQVGLDDFLEDVVHPEGGAVGDDIDGDVGQGMDVIDQFAKPAVERRFAGAGKGNIIGFRSGGQGGLEMGQDLVQRDKLPAFDGMMSGSAELAVDTIEGAGFKGDQIDAEGTSETAAGNGAENIFSIVHFTVSL